MITVLERLTRPITALQAAEFLGLPSSMADMMPLYIDAATSWLEEYSGYGVSKAKRLFYRAIDRGRFALPYPPLEGIEEIWVEHPNLQEPIRPEFRIFHLEVPVLLLEGGSWTADFTLRVIYISGWEVTPPEWQLEVLRLVSAMWNSRYNELVLRPPRRLYSPDLVY